MAENENFDKKQRRVTIFTSAALAGIVAVVGVDMHNHWLQEEERAALLTRLGASNAQAACATAVPPQAITKTLAPLLDLKDASTGLRGEGLIAHALQNGVDFVMCDDLPAAHTGAATAAFEKTARGYVLKLNAGAHDMQQQAATLQLMKEFYNTGASYATLANGGQKVVADPNLTRVMPGRVLDSQNIGDVIKPRLTREGVSVKVPMRSFP